MKRSKRMAVELPPLVRPEMYPMEMNMEENRLKSFATWPFLEDCACTPLKMAEAGFYHCPSDNEPDLVRCYVCFKELDGWSPDDDPWSEHRDHSYACAFVLLGKTFNQITVKEFIKLEFAKNSNYITKVLDFAKQQFDELEREVVERIQSNSR